MVKRFIEVLLLPEIHYLRFYVSVKNSISVHVLNRLEELIDVEFDSRFRQVRCSTLDCLVQIHLHELENESKATRGFITKQTK